MNLGVEKVVIWLAQEVEATEGAIWKRVEAMEGVEVVRATLPEKVGEWEVPVGERSAVARLVVLWHSGGAYSFSAFLMECCGFSKTWKSKNETGKHILSL